MKHSVITATYQGDNSITLFTRDENGNRKDIKVLGFEPYFYIPENEDITHTNVLESYVSDIPGVKGEKLRKIVTRTPHDVGQLREKVSKHYEADIPFTRRFMIDSGIFSGIELSDDKTVVRADEIVPVDFVQKPRFMVTDIEVYSEDKFPDAYDEKAKIILVCIYDSFSEKYLSIALDPQGRDEREETYAPNHQVIIVPTEHKLLMLLNDVMKHIDPDIYSGWYVSFDKDYQDVRNSQFSSRVAWDRTNVFDLMKAYRRLYAKGSDKLADVVVDEKLKIDNYEPFQNDMWKKYFRKAILVNKSHVEACIAINKKYNLLNFYWELKNLAGMDDLEPAIWHGSIVENRLLRAFHGKFVLPSRPSKEEVEKRVEKYGDLLEGGKVFTPPIGIFEGVANFDMTRYYPEMLISMNLSPEPHGKELGIVPKLTLDMIVIRIDFDNRLKLLIPGTPEHSNLKVRRLAVKDVIQTIVGYFGAPQSRVFDPEIFNRVTTTGQKGLVFLSKVCQKDGFRFIYGDTDSTLISIPLEQAHGYVDTLNESLKEFGRQEGIDRKLEIKLDRYFKRIIFKRKHGTDEGVKKKYAGIICLADLKKNVIWKSRGKNVPVGKVKVGDKLIAYNDGNFVETEVKEIIRRKCNDYLSIEIEEGIKHKQGSFPCGGAISRIIATKEHPFFVKNVWKRADELKVGEEFLFVSKNDKQRFQGIVDQTFIKKREDCLKARVHTKEERKATSEMMKKLWVEKRDVMMNSVKMAVQSHTDDSYRRMVETQRKKGMHERCSKRMKEENPMRNANYKTLSIQRRIERPTYIENLFISLSKKYKLPITYVGDGSLWIGKFGVKKEGIERNRMNPDFVVEEQKKVIEVYGSNLRKGFEKEYEKSRVDHYKKHGYKCLCLSINPNNFEEEQYAGIVNKFVHNGVKITKIKPSRIKNVDAINFHCEPYNNYFVNGVLTHNCWEDGKDVDYILVRGFEYVRRDASKITKEIQHKVFELILRQGKEEVLSYLKEKIGEIKAGNFLLDDLAIPKTIHKNPLEYDIPQDYVRGSLYANKWMDLGIRNGDVIKMLYVKSIDNYPHTDVVSVYSYKKIKGINVDIEAMIEKTIRAKVEDLVELVGIKWEDIYTRQMGLLA